MTRRCRALILILGLAISGFAIAVFVWRFVAKWDKFTEAFSQGKWVWLAPATAVLMLVFVVKVFRWQIIMKPVASPGYGSLFSATVIGFMANCLLPARAGEVVRAAVIGSGGAVKKSSAFATIVVERIFDFIGLGAISLAALAWLAWGHKETTRASEALQFGTILVGAAAVLGFLFLVFVRLRPDHGRKWALLLVCWLPGRSRDYARSVVGSFVEGLAVIRGAGQAGWLVGLSVVHWVMMGLIAYVTGLCFKGQVFQAPGGERVFYLGLGGAFLVVAIQSVAVALPQAPSFVGVHQAASAAATNIAVGSGCEGIAGAYALVLWCVLVLPVIALGVGCLWKRGMSLAQMRRMGQEDQREGEKGARSSSTASMEG